MGGGSGMGREICAQLAAEGASIAMCDMAEEGIAEEGEEMEELGPIDTGSRVGDAFQASVPVAPTQSTFFARHGESTPRT